MGDISLSKCIGVVGSEMVQMLCSGRMDGFMDKWNGGGGVLCNSLSVHSQKRKKKKKPPAFLLANLRLVFLQKVAALYNLSPQPG